MNLEPVKNFNDIDKYLNDIIDNFDKLSEQEKRKIADDAENLENSLHLFRSLILSRDSGRFEA